MYKKLSIIFAILLVFHVYIFVAPAYAAKARAALLYNLTTGKVLYEYNRNLAIAPASLTKIMTMYLAMDAIKAGQLNYKQKILVPKEAATIGGSAMHLNAGERTPVTRLLTGMVVSSGNDAAMAIALHLGGSAQKFTQLMNKKAAQLGMRSTKFRKPTGLPAAGQKTTANDLLLLCKSYLKTHPDALRFHGMKNFMHKGSVAYNTNPLLGRVDGVNGLKTGWTVASGYNLIITAQKGKNKLLAIILGSPDKKSRDALAINLINKGTGAAEKPLLAARSNRVKK